ncbi:MAG TPA: hypothetical protein VKB86_16095 [Pyrinomonadaceae bacterium]|nr:hypothetical protein [Pyrinomonadaceae bacterium]
MRLSLKAVLVSVIVVLTLTGIVQAQAGRNRQTTTPQQKKVERTENAPGTEQDAMKLKRIRTTKTLRPSGSRRTLSPSRSSSATAATNIYRI